LHISNSCGVSTGKIFVDGRVVNFLLSIIISIVSGIFLTTADNVYNLSVFYSAITRVSQIAVDSISVLSTISFYKFWTCISFQFIAVLNSLTLVERILVLELRD
jgi:hypothetical protein